MPDRIFLPRAKSSKFVPSAIPFLYVLLISFSLVSCSPKISKAPDESITAHFPRFVPSAKIDSFIYDTIPQWELPADSLYEAITAADSLCEPISTDDSLLLKQNINREAVILPPPPANDTSDITFKKDLERYHWGKSIRSTKRGRQASHESLFGIVRMCTIYSEVFGFVIHPQTTPAIYRLMLYAGETGYRKTWPAKRKYDRPRPFELMNEPVWGEFDDESLKDDGSYPSGHTALGLATALVLAQMVSDNEAPGQNPKTILLKNLILKCGYEYGESRVIVGAHWQSDVDAGYKAAAAAFSAMQKNPRYRKHLEAARKEYQALKTQKEHQALKTRKEYQAPKTQK